MHSLLIFVEIHFKQFYFHNLLKIKDKIDFQCSGIYTIITKRIGLLDGYQHMPGNLKKY